MNTHSKPTSEDANQNTLLSQKETVSHNWQRILERSQNDKSRLGLVIKDFVQLIETHHRTQHYLKFYAAELTMSKSNLRKICQREIGVSPTSCIYARITLEACTLLKDARRSVSEIASDLGFEDPKHFSKFFKRHSGLYPESYRKFFRES